MLKPEQARLLQLALRPVGGASRDKNPNYYLAPKGTDEDYQWMILSRDGYAEEFRDSISIRTWRVTKAGKIALAEFQQRTRATTEKT